MSLCKKAICELKAPKVSHHRPFLLPQAAVGRQLDEEVVEERSTSSAYKEDENHVPEGSHQNQEANKDREEDQ